MTKNNGFFQWIESGSQALDLEMQEIGREIAREQNELTGQEEPFRRTPLFHDEAAE